jgi:hypothetical protein
MPDRDFYSSFFAGGGGPVRHTAKALSLRSESETSTGKRAMKEHPCCYYQCPEEGTIHSGENGNPGTEWIPKKAWDWIRKHDQS